MTRQEELEGTMMQKWYRGEATAAEREILLLRKYLRVTNKTYGHVEATDKGFRVASRLNGLTEQEIKETLDNE